MRPLSARSDSMHKQEFVGTTDRMETFPANQILVFVTSVAGNHHTASFRSCCGCVTFGRFLWFYAIHSLSHRCGATQWQCSSLSNTPDTNNQISLLYSRPYFSVHRFYYGMHTTHRTASKLNALKREANRKKNNCRHPNRQMRLCRARNGTPTF